MTKDEITPALAEFDRGIATMKDANAAWQALRVLTDRWSAPNSSR